MGRQLRIGLHSPYFGSTYGGGEKYLGTAAEVLRDAYPQHRVEIVSPVPVNRERYEQVLGLDLRGIELRSGVRRVTALHRLVARAAWLRPLRNRLVARQAAALTRDYDLWIAMAYVIPALSAARRSVMLCQFPYPLQTAKMARDLAVFDPVICQSRYVQECVERIWSRSSAILYPPIDVPPEEPDWARKQPIILSVGRFVAGGHVKRHDVLVSAFRQLCDQGLAGWELHLVGSSHQDAASQEYLRTITARGEGYPIRIHADAPLAELHSLYRSASLYWHAAGFGVDAQTHPEALEHFGMTTVEAMAFGGVPVVIARGGQTEVVMDGETGYLWNDVETLQRRTKEVIENLDLRRRLGAAAREESRHFARAHFARTLEALVEPVLSNLG